MNPFANIREKQTPLPEVDLTKGKSIAETRSVLSRMMGVTDANSQGNVHGGLIMHMVDEAAAVVAIRHAHRNVVTARVERFDFLAPAYIGNVVSVHCAMNYVGRTSMEVGVEVRAEDPLTGELREVASSYVIYVALDEAGKPVPVPPLVPGDDQEAMIIDLARIRRDRVAKVTAEMEKLRREYRTIDQTER